MSVLALSLNLGLGALLLGALWMGLRLDHKLRALRDSQHGFVKAVQELDQAAARTQSSLVELKATTEAARTALVERIDESRRLAERLDGLIAKARAEAENQPQVASRRAPAEVAAERLAPVRRRIDAMTAKPESPADPTPAAGASPAPTRSRAPIDDDLFDGDAARLAGGRP